MSKRRPPLRDEQKSYVLISGTWQNETVYLFGEGFGAHGHLSFLGGTRERDESEIETAARELHEETAGLLRRDWALRWIRDGLPLLQTREATYFYAHCPDLPACLTEKSFNAARARARRPEMREMLQLYWVTATQLVGALAGGVGATFCTTSGRDFTMSKNMRRRLLRLVNAVGARERKVAVYSPLVRD